MQKPIQQGSWNMVHLHSLMKTLRQFSSCQTMNCEKKTKDPFTKSKPEKVKFSQSQTKTSPKQIDASSSHPPVQNSCQSWVPSLDNSLPTTLQICSTKTSTNQETWQKVLRWSRFPHHLNPKISNYIQMIKSHNYVLFFFWCFSIIGRHQKKILNRGRWEW